MLTFFAYAITVIGLNLLFGYTGLLSFGHALFMAVGAYTAAFLTSKFSVLIYGDHSCHLCDRGFHSGCVDWRDLCPVYQDLFRHADPCFRHAL
ncbi:MAG TPA: hypothetical protein VK551_02700 [Thermodesulfobacteriota bacterium]|nr:hypothetical protein [Thermodesulfobacteriota bacterium]